MFARLLAADDNRAFTLLRVTLGLVMLPHGAQKVLGWFGGAGIEGTVAGMGQAFGIPALLALVAIAVEFLGPLALLLGAGTRLAALGLAGQMLVAGSFHRANGYFMNWSGTQGGEGFEFHLLYLGAALALAIGGAGAWSIDRAMTRAAEPAEPAAAPRLRKAA